MSIQMKALIKRAAEPGIWMESAPVPPVGTNEVLIKVEKTAICGTDLHIYNWDEWSQRTIKPPAGFKLSHLPESRAVKSRFGSLEITLEAQGKNVVAKTEYTLVVDRVEQPDYAGFRRFVEQADKLLRERNAFAPESK